MTTTASSVVEDEAVKRRAAQSHLAVSVHSLGKERQLPLLVTDLIASYLDESGTSILSNLSVVSKALNQFTTTVIYRDIELDFSKDACKAALLLRTLRTNQMARGAVRSLTLTNRRPTYWIRQDVADLDVHCDEDDLNLNLDTLVSGDLSLERTRPMTERTFMAHSAVARLSIEIICLAAGLQELSVSTGIFEYPAFRSAWSAMRVLEASLSLQNLRKCSIALDVAEKISDLGYLVEFASDWDTALIMPFFAPNIETISAVMTLVPASVDPLLLSSVTRLNLHHYQGRKYELKPLLTATPKLRFLEYDAIVQFDQNRRPPALNDLIGLGVLYEALHLVNDTLEELVATQTYVSNDHHFEGGYEHDYPHPDFYISNLKALSRLRCLSLPYMSLLGRKAREASVWNWATILPATLRSLTLTNHLDENEWNYDPSWEEDELTDTFMTILDWMTTNTPEHQSSLFALRFHGVGDEDFPDRPWQQKMDRLCQDRHLRFSLEKLPWEDYQGQRWPPL
ncbi:hypothetical protein B0A48_05027 [Cryoendolithus antarcticus]|uniref:F-box domain-containing protein n=1 Tax=Cryoendolithus antarcticus TaxID=1507870 RepID=A0A1V8TE20_9PEZI|nr:hypothetical protein B0A48_05027 [Cryoendolithus antarcticus]